MRAVVLSLLLILSVAACGGDRESVPPPDDTSTYPGSNDPELVELAQTARADLAEQLGVTEEELSIVLAERVTWPNGALGCEEEGMSYTQALVEGYRIRIEHDGEPYHYHGEEGGEPFYCADPPDDQTGARSGD